MKQTNTFIEQPSARYFGALDGFRGGLALWVYLGHLAAAVGYANYFLGLHALAVDLFMVLSGFLMMHTWRAPFGDFGLIRLRNVLAFYVVRLFRIAPPYYALLLVCYLWLPQLNQMHDFVHKTIPPSWVQDVSAYEPKIGWDFSTLRWLYLHATFAFGAVPGMEASTPLPDWSLSLEMQFYLVFPVLLFGLARLPLLIVSLVAMVLALISPALFGSYLTPGTWAHFGQPSLLLYRLNAFMAGMLLAYWLCQKNDKTRIRKSNWATILAIGLCLIPLSKPVVVIYLLFVGLVLQKLKWLALVLSHKAFGQLGDLSYAIYLAHLLVVIPVTYWLIQYPEFMNLSAVARFGMAVALTAPIVLGLSVILHQMIELPGIRMGKSLSRAILSG